MKIFIRRLFLFVILLYTGSLIIDILISKIAQPRAEFSSWKDLYSNNINADMLIFGSSRTMNHFNPQMIEDSLNLSAYNMGLSGSRIEISLLRLKEHLRICTKKPRYITLEIDWMTCDGAKIHYCPWQMFPYMLYNKNIYKYTHDYKGFYTHYYLIPLVRYVKYLPDIFKNRHRTYYRNPNVLGKGFVVLTRSWDETTQNVNPFKASIPNEEKEYLKEFIDICRYNKIQLNMVYAPEHIKVNKIVTNRDTIIDYFKQLSTLNNIPFADFSTLELCSDSVYFYNHRHLNIRGANKFTSEYYIPWIKELYGL